LLLAFAAYLGVHLGRQYLKYWRFEDAMREEAARATGRSDSEIRLDSEYEVVLELPFHSYVHTFRPRPRQPL